MHDEHFQCMAKLSIKIDSMYSMKVISQNISMLFQKEFFRINFPILFETPMGLSHQVFVREFKISSF